MQITETIQARMRELFEEMPRGFLQSLIDLADPNAAADAASLERASLHGTTVTLVHTGFDALRRGDLATARELADVPFVPQPLADLLEALKDDESLPEELRKAFGAASQAARADLDDGIRQVAGIPTPLLLHLSPAARRRAEQVVTSSRLVQVARAALAGRFEEAERALIDTMAFARSRRWLLETQTAVATLATLAGTEESRAIAMRILDTVAPRLARAAMDEGFYARLAFVEDELGRAEHGTQFLHHGLAERCRDPRILQRLAAAILRRRPDDALAHQLIGVTRYYESDFDGALPHLEAAKASERPVDLILGLTLNLLGESERAMDVLTPLLQEESPPREALLVIAESRRTAGDREGARRIGERLAGVGGPYGSQVEVLQANVAMDEGNRELAHTHMFTAPDACDPAAIAAYRRLEKMHRESDDEKRAILCAKEADDAIALPPTVGLHAFITGMTGHPALVSRDHGGVFFAGVHRRTGANILWRCRGVHKDEVERPLPPMIYSSPYLLEASASAVYGSTRQTVYPSPLAQTLASLLAEPRKLDKIRRNLLLSLAAAAVDLERLGASLGFVVPERTFVGNEGGPTFTPFDPYDDPRAQQLGQASPPSIAPEVVRGGADSVSSASDVFGIAAMAKRCFNDVEIEHLPSNLATVLTAAAAPLPGDRPSPIELLSTFIREVY